MAVGSIVRSPISGVIREIRLGRGDVAAAGAVVATVGPDRQGYFQVVALLRGKTRKRAAPGMEARIVPDSIEEGRIWLDAGPRDRYLRRRRLRRARRPDRAQRSTHQAACLAASRPCSPTSSWFRPRTIRAASSGGAAQDRPTRSLPGRSPPSTSSSNGYGRSPWSFRRCASCSASRDEPPARPIPDAAGSHADRLPDGDGRMRCRGAWHRARLLSGGASRSRSCVVACGVSREGSKPADLVRAAQSYGLERHRSRSGGRTDVLGGPSR